MLNLLWPSVLKLTEKFWTTFNLKQEAFIGRDEVWPEEGWYLWGEGLHTIRRSKMNCEVLTFTPCIEGWLINDQCLDRWEETFAMFFFRKNKLYVKHTLWQLNRDNSTSRLSWWSKLYYNKLLPTGSSSPAPRFYGLPKIHKANCPMWRIVSACGTATYQLAIFHTKILQKYTGITPMFVKDSRGFSQYLRSVYLGEDKELVSFNVSALFTSIPVPQISMS